MLKQILKEIKNHAPFTFIGALTGLIIMVLMRQIPYKIAYNTFYILHPTHVFLSALVTASMYKLHACDRISGKCLTGKCNYWFLFIIGYIGSVGIATLSDSIIPYLGETLLNMPHRNIHLGFIEKWWLVNPLAIIGIVIASIRPTTKFPHSAHVLVSTWASLFHIMMAIGNSLNTVSYLVILLFLFLAVWIPCCVSDIVFPLLFVKSNRTNKFNTIEQ